MLVLVISTPARACMTVAFDRTRHDGRMAGWPDEQMAKWGDSALTLGLFERDGRPPESRVPLRTLQPVPCPAANLMQPRPRIASRYEHGCGKVIWQQIKYSRQSASGILCEFGP